MQFDSAGNPVFTELNATFLLLESMPINFGGSIDATHFLTMRALCDVGLLTSDSGTPIPARRLRPTPPILQLIDKDSGWAMEALPLDAAVSLLQLAPGEILPAANCHGFTFADSAYWIDDAAIQSLLTGDGWEEVESRDASVAVFRCEGEIVHSCKVRQKKQALEFAGKAGIGAVQLTNDEVAAARGNHYDRVTYYRRNDSRTVS
jgi:hypothetical protein